MTYGELARRVAADTGRPRLSAQAVGGAVGHTPLWLVIPCHRAIGAGGNLTGYAGGLTRKIALLAQEGHDPACFTFPPTEAPKAKSPR